jgi:hypothetical protein
MQDYTQNPEGFLQSGAHKPRARECAAAKNLSKKPRQKETCMRHRRRSKEPKGDHSHSSRPAPPDGVEEDNEKSTEGDREREGRRERERGQDGTGEARINGQY